MKNKKNIILLISSVVIIAGTYFFVTSGSDKKMPVNVSSKTKIENVLNVSVVETDLIDYTPIISGSGEVKEMVDLEYKIDLTGRINYINDDFKEGSIIKKGTILAKIDDKDYKAAVSNANLSLSDAKISLLEQEREYEQAKIEWESSGIKGAPASSLVLKVPQLEKAKISLEYAKNLYDIAIEDLNNTTIKAPFDLYVSEKNIEDGSYLTSGSIIGRFFGINNYEIEVPLSQDKWDYFSENNLLSKNVILEDLFTEKKWDAYISKISKEIDVETRQRSIFVGIKDPLERNLFTGLFLKVHIEGDVLKNVWKIPYSALLTENGKSYYVLYVNNDNRIEKLKVNNYYQLNEDVYVTPYDNSFASSNINIIKKPLATYKVNSKVKIIGEE